MKRVALGKTRIEVSYWGLGTSTAYDEYVCRAKLKASDYPSLLRFGYEHGVTLFGKMYNWNEDIGRRTPDKLCPCCNYICKISVIYYIDCSRMLFTK